MLNRKGPNIGPCGPPVVILPHALSVLFTLTLCFLFIKLLFMYFKAYVSNPYAPKVTINKSWFNVS